MGTNKLIKDDTLIKNIPETKWFWKNIKVIKDYIYDLNKWFITDKTPIEAREIKIKDMLAGEIPNLIKDLVTIEGEMSNGKEWVVVHIENADNYDLEFDLFIDLVWKGSDILELQLRDYCIIQTDDKVLKNISIG